MSNDYTVLLKAMINDASLRANIKEIEKSLVLNLKVNASAGGAGGVTGIAGASKDIEKIAAAAKSSGAELTTMANGWKQLGFATAEYTRGGVDGIDTLYKATAKIPLALGETATITAKVNNATGDLVVSQKKLNNEFGVGTDKANTFGTQMLHNIAKFAQWTLAAAVVAGSMRAIGEAIKYIEDLNKSMIETQVVTGETDSQIASLAQRYNSLAGTLGATTQQVAQGALEWRRQGKDVEESLQMTTASIMMSKLANMDSAQATEQLTATLNGFKMEASDVTPVIDKLVSLDNAYATSVTEISTAMQYSAAVANQAKISFDELAAYIN